MGPSTDRVTIGPIYREERVPASDRLDRVALAGALADASAPDTVEAIVEQLAAEAVAGDLVLFLSNGAFGGIYRKVCERFSAG